MWNTAKAMLEGTFVASNVYVRKKERLENK